MQVHTINLIFPLGEHDIINLKNKHSIEISQVNEFQSDYDYATFSITRQPFGRYYLSMVIDCILLLDKVHMLNSDYYSIERSIKTILMDMFGHGKHFESHVLKRIDYKFDAYVPDEKDRKLLLDLYRKLTRSFRHQKMRDGIIKDNKELQVYEVDDREFETTIYHSSNSLRVVTYDKEAERDAKKELPKKYEKGILRYEIAVMQKHINYRRNRKECPNPIDAKLGNYFQEGMWKAYFSNYLSPIYLHGDFYKMSEAKKIINKSSERTSMKRKLIEFLTMISRGNIDTPSNKGMNPKTIKSRKNKLEALGINPILIPQNHKDAPLKLKNPLNMFYKKNTKPKKMTTIKLSF